MRCSEWRNCKYFQLNYNTPEQYPLWFCVHWKMSNKMKMYVGSSNT